MAAQHLSASDESEEEEFTPLLDRSYAEPSELSPLLPQPARAISTTRAVAAAAAAAEGALTPPWDATRRLTAQLLAAFSAAARPVSALSTEPTDSPSAWVRARSSLSAALTSADGYHALLVLLIVGLWLRSPASGGGLALYLLQTLLLLRSNQLVSSRCRDQPATREVHAVAAMLALFHVHVTSADDVRRVLALGAPKEPLPDDALSHTLKIAFLADAAARGAAALLKLLTLLATPSASGLRLRRIITAEELVGRAYRVVLPMRCWHRWLGLTDNVGSSIAVVAYVALKATQLAAHARAAFHATLDVLWSRGPLRRRKFVSDDDLAEMGHCDCPICFSPFTTPILLECSHAFCEDCINSWIDRASSPTCPLCRARVSLRAAQSSSEETPLVPSLF